MNPLRDRFGNGPKTFFATVSAPMSRSITPSMSLLPPPLERSWDRFRVRLRISVNIALSFLAVSFAAFCLWLAVRIVNRHERWAMRTAWGVAAILMLYPLSLGPACRMAAEPMDLGYMMPAPRPWMTFYWPIGWLASDVSRTPSRSGDRGPKSLFRPAVAWYVNLWLPRDTVVVIPAARNGETNLLLGTY